MPVPTLETMPLVAPPKPVASVTVLPLVLKVAVVALTRPRRAEMSCVLTPFHCSVPPFIVIVPVVPRPPLPKLSVPAVSVVPPL